MTVHVLDNDTTEPPPPTPTPAPPPPTPTPAPPPPTSTPAPPPPTPRPRPPSRPRPRPTPTPTLTPTPTPPPPTPTPTPTPTPPPTPVPTPTATPTPTKTPETEQGEGTESGEAAGPTGTPPVQNAVVALPTVEPVARPSQRELEAPAVPVIGEAIPRIRDTLSGIASTPRRRTTLIIIQGVTILFAILVFGYLVFRRR